MVSVQAPEPVDYDPFAGGVLARVVPTTEPQREIWLADALGQDASLAFNESACLRLKGNLNVDALRGALQDLVDRHDALRAGFGPDGDTLCIVDAVVQRLDELDVSALDAQAREQKIAERLRLSVDTPFSLRTDRLFRTELLRVSNDEHVLVMTAHHIVCDGWSWWVLVQELGALYGSRCGDPSRKLGVAPSFADYALVQSRAPEASSLEDERYWLSRFAGELPVLDLPTDRVRPSRRSFDSAREDHLLDKTLVAALQALGARQGCSLFATLLASFAGLVARLSGQQRVVVGIPAAGQAIDGHGQLVGHCVNTLPLLFEHDMAAEAASTIVAAQATLLDAIEHQRYTLGTLLRKLKAGRDPARLPLVSVMFNIDQALEQQRHALPGILLDFSTVPRTHENFEIFVNAVQLDEGMRLECQYNTALFDGSTIRRWLGHWGTMLEAMVQDPSCAFGRLPLLSETERWQVIERWNDTQVGYDLERCVHELVEAQVERSPEAIAVSDAALSLTYAELNARANRLAHHLRTLGAAPDQRVAVLAERSVDLVVGLLGVLKAGAAYVPVDPGNPAERIAYMLKDSAPCVVLTQERLSARLKDAGVTLPLLLLDADRPAWADGPDANPGRNGVGATSLAYVIYTSGSTGVPKGAMNEHRGVVNRLLWMQDAYGLRDDDTVLQKTPFGFDVSVWEFFWPLMAGARLVMARPEGHKDPAYLEQAIRDQHVTTLHFVPSMLQVFLEQLAVRPAPTLQTSLRRVICSGEALPPVLVTRFHEYLPGVELHNLYGPTEAAVDVTSWACTDPAPTNVPIGRPIANTRMYVLDGFGQPAPIGVGGELVIGGVQVGRGYLNRPELTAERFVDDPFVRDGTARMYRTGDLARWRIDGCLEYLGRNDFQVKLRGFRIELGEIEKRLESHAGVAQAVVVARADASGTMRLVAYVVGRSGERLVDAELANHLKAGLPEYMVPSQFVMLEAMPLSHNGKVDRNALPVPEFEVDASVGQFEAPRDELEQTIAAVLADVLGRDAVGIHDDFFQLGGHSLLAARACARLTRELAVEVPLRSLFDAPTVSRLAELLRRKQDVPSAAGAWNVPRRDEQGTAPMSLMQQRLWVLEQMEPDGVTWNTPSAHRLRGNLDVHALDRAFQEVVKRQASLRTCFVSEGDGAVQSIARSLDVSLLPMEDFSEVEEGARERTLRDRIECLIAKPFQLDMAPLFRARLFRLGPQDHVLFFMTHHIIWDGWSFDLFYDEMAALYSAFSQGAVSPLTELDVSYGDFAEWHLGRLSGEELKRQLGYWRQQLEGAIEPLDLPTDFARPVQMTGAGSTEWLKFDRGTTEALRAIGNRAGATLFMTLLATYALLLHRLTGQRDLVVGVPVRNRSTEALERVMGLFVNMLPLRLSVDPAQPFLDLVRSVRDRVVEAFSYPDVPFEQLVRELRLPRDPSRSPIYQALFSFQDVRQRPTRWGDLRHERFPVFQPGTSQDIGLWFVENAQGLVGGLTYSTDILSPATAARHHQRLATLLDAVCADPTIPVGEAPLCAASDIELLERWNATTSDGLPASDLVELLQESFAATPDRIALRFGDTAVTYGDLDASSNRIANVLRGRGVANGDLVGVCLERGPDLVAALIGVLKAGAGYVPLDPAYPAARLRFIADDAALAMIIAEGELGSGVGAPRERLLLLDGDRAEIEFAPAELGPGMGPAGPAAVAYVIYTSGSTGQPKGVRIPHRAVVNFLASMRREPGIEADDRLLAVTTTSFDIAVLELFLPLSVGAEVVLASHEDASDGHTLAVLLAACGATIMQATPSTWRMLLDVGWRGASRLKVLVGGEPLPPALAAQLCAGCGEVWNMYGPTETTVWSTCGRVDRPDDPITIGRPIANTTVWVRDARGQRCPIGVPGELWIGGDGVALGYHERPELDTERFMDDPYSSKPGARLYRTGDRGRWLADGQLEHLGRLDFQVKVRGYRIELGEIEARVACDPTVAEVTAIAREDRPGDVRLVAYVVARNGAHVDVGGLRARLRAILPDYMVPQHIVPLDSLPRLPNGKLDRKSLPPPLPAEGAAATAEAAHDVDDPRVVYLATIWSDLLGVAAGPDDNFFDLGGHSMLAVQMANRVANDTGVRIRLVRLATQTLAQVAADLPTSLSGAESETSRRGLVRNVMRLFGLAATEGKP